jgi:hypothetical protein
MAATSKSKPRLTLERVRGSCKSDPCKGKDAEAPEGRKEAPRESPCALAVGGRHPHGSCMGMLQACILRADRLSAPCRLGGRHHRVTAGFAKNCSFLVEAPGSH